MHLRRRLNKRKPTENKPSTGEREEQEERGECYFTGVWNPPGKKGTKEKLSPRCWEDSLSSPFAATLVVTTGTVRAASLVRLYATAMKSRFSHFILFIYLFIVCLFCFSFFKMACSGSLGLLKHLSKKEGGTTS